MHPSPQMHDTLMRGVGGQSRFSWIAVGDAQPAIRNESYFPQVADGLLNPGRASLGKALECSF